MCSRRHQRRIIQAKTQHEYHVENNFDHSIQNQLNIKVDTNNNNASSTFESNETVDNDFEEMFNKSNTSCSDFEQCEVSNEILNGDNYESPSNFSDKSDDESIDNGENDTNIDTLKADLSQWALKYAIHHNAINDLLSIISKYIPSCSLPRDARTLLRTPRETNVVDLAGGQYVHFGLIPALHSIMQELKNAGLSVDNINLSLNIDGLPISKSSTNSFWPILISENIFRTVEVIGVYYGQKKPTSANDYLRKFVNELKSVIDNGFIYKNK